MNDKINGIFEIVGAVLLLKNIYLLHRDKSLAGVSIIPTAHFTLWGVWNLWYYPSLGQMWSLWGAVGIVSANSVWVVMAVWYSRRQRAGGIDEWHQDKPEEPDLRTFDDFNKGGVLIGEDVTFQDMSSGDVQEKTPPNNEVDMCLAYGKPCEDVSRVECDRINDGKCYHDNAGTAFARKTKRDLELAGEQLELAQKPDCKTVSDANAWIDGLDGVGKIKNHDGIVHAAALILRLEAKDVLIVQQRKELAELKSDLATRRQSNAVLVRECKMLKSKLENATKLAWQETDEVAE